ncbi:MAG: sulfite exporter TauE/SafE family protein [Pseudolabrys sp.]
MTAGVFAGAVVSGLVGFAFSAVAGAILLHVLPPTEAVPLMMACSIVTQAVSLVALRKTVKWRGHPVLIAAGALGVLPALFVLHHIDPRVFRIGFGAFLVAYAGYMLLRPAIASGGDTQGRLRHALVGFGGGLVGGLTAMPGALPTIWCDLRGMPRNLQRGLVQPYITVMQLFALTLMLSNDRLSAQTLLNVTFSLPALAAGAMLGVVLFRKVNDALFRSVTLVVLMFAGAGLTV